MVTRGFTATVKENAEGRPWLVVEPYDDNGVPSGQHIVMDLPREADIEQAQQVARFLNANLMAIRLARF
jgi:hypothetical protein